MGCKFTVHYGLYVAHGFVSAHLANQTETAKKTSNIWQSLAQMFEHYRSDAR